MKTTLFAGLIAVAFALPLTVHSAGPRVDASNGQQGASKSSGASAAYLAEKELLRRELSYELAPIRSRQDLSAYLRSIQSRSPLARMSPAGQRRFLESLTFNERGLTGYGSDDLLAELSASEIYRVLSLFGAQHAAPFMDRARVSNDVDRAIAPLGFGDMCDSEGGDTCGGDKQNAKCVGAGTCQMHVVGFICTSNC